MKRLLRLWQALKSTVSLFFKHDTLTHGAALSYYMLFSFAPILLIVIVITGLIWGEAAVQGEVKRQIEGLLGSDSATQIQELIKAAYRPGGKIITAIISGVVLIVGATSVFAQLRTSLNTIWDVTPKTKQAVLKYFIDRLFSLAMIVCLAFLLLVSLVIHMGLEAFINVAIRRYPHITVLLVILDFCLSFSLTMVLFVLIYKFMSDARLKWRRVWAGAFFTAILFIIGKYVIALYISKTNMSSSFGAAGFVILLLVWVFYSSQILFFGAEFTRALAEQDGLPLDPNAINNKKNSAKAAKAQQAGQK